MATNSPKTNTFRKKGDPSKKVDPTPKGPGVTLGKFKSNKLVLTLGILLISASIFLFIAFVSYLLNGPTDQSLVMNNPDEAIRDTAKETTNWLGYLGAQASNWLIYRWFGMAAFLFPPFLFILGFRWAFKVSLVSLTRYTTFALFFTFWLGLFTGYIVILVQGYSYWSFLSGGFGYELAKLSADFLGWGTFILIGGALLIFVVFFFDIDKLEWFSSKPADENELDSVLEKSAPVQNPFKNGLGPQQNEIEEEGELEENGLDDDGSAWTIKGTEAEEVTSKKVKPPIVFDVPQLNILDTTLRQKKKIVR
jgi:S-DNA-T family DNA segregation ATPase FtsK/SpoIIIE